MQPVLSPEEMRAVDETARREVGLDALVARAGTLVAREARSILQGAYGRRVVVVAGPGNNGSDGRVAARLLARRGAAVTLVGPDAAAVEPPCDLVIDAAFGTGFHGSYRAPLLPAGTPVLAVDVPSGLDSLTGKSPPGSPKALRTITFGALKPGLLLGEGPERCGEVRLETIGLPLDAVAAQVRLVEDRDLKELLPARPRAGHKWLTALAVVAGSPGMLGAARLVSAAAMRAGAGMVRLGVPGAAPADLPYGEAVATALSAESFDTEIGDLLSRVHALVVGPGLGRKAPTIESVRRLVAASGAVPTLVDADGLYALGTAAEARAAVEARKGGAPVVLTPHDGELARLAGDPVGPDRLGGVRDLARRTGAIVLSKGPTTVVASPEGAVILSTTGTPALATAGSGDALSGVIGAFLARGVPALEAAALGAYLHGRAARLGPREGLVAGDLPDLVSEALSEICGG